ncbi:Nif3-like dinuclear metal center hexameric protein [Campylobacter californiensis]|uniref:Nif3-like dinuclear metal center hexameric protein n=1 Tax=Campylobacter californiensis TaxID=1032243 RepID=UPI0014760542|nr:Nif3-like dinuclear metal center hexameric protein [Campylobacter sp. RM12916]MBE3608931.1 Nif3-like dinuclear metal center hexameric protein [Campylobacter sp. RM12916]
MKIFEIYEHLNKIAPFDTQEEWDNSGLLVGSFESEFEQIYLSLDIDSELVDKIKPNSLLITHHPLIFKGLKVMNFAKYPSGIIAEMIKKNISLISMHTNFDKAVLNRYFVTEILGFDISRSDEFLIYCDVNLNFKELVDLVKDRLNLNQIRTVYAKDEIKTIAICTGSGADLMPYVKADVLLTGDIKYHQALEARENLLNLIDINHYESEQYFGESLAKYLQNLGVLIIISNSKNPFTHF